MNDRGKCVVYLGASILSLIVLLMSSITQSGGLITSIMFYTTMAVLIIGLVFNLCYMLWILYYEKYANLYLIRIVLFVCLVMLMILVSFHAMTSVEIDFRLVLINFILIFTNNIDFVVDNVTKMLQYNKK